MYKNISKCTYGLPVHTSDIVYVWARNTQETSLYSCLFCCEPKISLKNCLNKEKWHSQFPKKW